MKKLALVTTLFSTILSNQNCLASDLGFVLCRTQFYHSSIISDDGNNYIKIFSDHHLIDRDQNKVYSFDPNTGKDGKFVELEVTKVETKETSFPFGPNAIKKLGYTYYSGTEKLVYISHKFDEPNGEIHGFNWKRMLSFRTCQKVTISDFCDKEHGNFCKSDD